MAQKVQLTQEEGRKYFAATGAGASHEDAYKQATGRTAPGSGSGKKASSSGAQKKADAAEQRNVNRARAKGKTSGGSATKGGSGPAGNRGAQAARARGQLARGAQQVAGPGVGAVVKALVTAFALVLLLGILLVPRAGGWSGAGVISTLLNKLNGFFEAVVSPSSFFTVSGSGSGSGSGSTSPSTPSSSTNQTSPNYRPTPAPVGTHPASS